MTGDVFLYRIAVASSGFKSTMSVLKQFHVHKYVMYNENVHTCGRQFAQELPTFFAVQRL